MTKRILALALAPLLIQACSSPAEPDRVRVIGVVDFYHESINDVVSAPDTVEAGVAFEVTITTFGGGCDRPAGTTSETAGSQADVTPYDLTPSRHFEYACPDILLRMPRVAVLEFAEPGPATLRVHGRRLDAETERSGVPVMIQKTIFVR